MQILRLVLPGDFWKQDVVSAVITAGERVLGEEGDRMKRLVDVTNKVHEPAEKERLFALFLISIRGLSQDLKGMVDSLRSVDLVWVETCVPFGDQIHGQMVLKGISRSLIYVN